MAGGVLGRVGVVKIGDLLVPLGGLRATQVRPRHKGMVAAHLDLGLEGVGDVGLVLVRRAVVDEKDRDRARALRDVLLEILRRDQPFDDMELEAAGAGHIVHHRVAGPA